MRARIAIVLTAVLVGAACQSQGEAANRVTIGESPAEAGYGLPTTIQQHIDEGNIAYRAKDFAGALRHYQQAADLDPSQPTPWFGVAMAASALGDEELAESARQRVQQLDPNLGAASHEMKVQKPHP
jgi:Flp pilus assembly protein TadD